MAVLASAIGNLTHQPTEQSQRVLRRQLEEYGVGVRWPPASQAVRPDQRNAHSWKTLPSSPVKAVTEKTSLCNSNS
jgi:hypothetical protein